MLLLDLDDTLFETATIDARVFDPAKKIIEDYALPLFGAEKFAQMVTQLKQLPFDVVAKHYQFPTTLSEQFYHTIESISYAFNIAPFPDYPALQQLPHPKILVTTGFPKVQQAKIDALQIASDFEAIYIDNPFDPQRKFKRGIFSAILSSYHLAPQQVWAIGDNPASELQAARALGINTIQRKTSHHLPWDEADGFIHSFEELAALLPLA